MKKRDTKEILLVAATVIAAPEQPLASGYKYYVVDTHSDIPDAFFETFDEAALYQKDFAEHHEYVIVKIHNQYNVYNMEPIENDTQTVQKSE